MAAIGGSGIEQAIDEFPVAALAKSDLGLRVIAEMLELLLSLRQATDTRLELGVAIAKFLLDAVIEVPDTRRTRGRPLYTPPGSSFPVS